MAHRALVALLALAVFVVSLAARGELAAQGEGVQAPGGRPGGPGGAGGRGGGRGAPPPPAEPRLACTVSADLQAPESAYFDHDSNSVFIANINGNVTAKDGNGYISKLTPDGRMVKAQWVTGLNGPKGMRSVNGVLWVADIDEVVGIDIFREKVVERVKVEGATFLNDLAAAPDGTIYTTDSTGGRVYMVRSGKSSVFVEGGDLRQPNGILVDGQKLIVGTIGAGGGRGRGAGAGGAPAAGQAPGAAQAPQPGGKLLVFDRTTKQQSELTKEPVGGIDGIERDGNGGYLVSDVLGSRLFYVRPDGTTRDLVKFEAAGADIGYVGWKRQVVVPFLFGNSVSGYDLTGVIP
jgi:sugar lactone lactonase YvrE